MAADVDVAGASSAHHQASSIFSLSSTPIGGIAQITVTQAQRDQAQHGSRVITQNRAGMGDRATIETGKSDETSTETQITGGGMSENNAWFAFLKSPHFTVISTGAITVLAGVGMFVMLDNKISALRMETKSDLQLSWDRTEAQFGKVDGRFDKVDSKFDAVLSKIDSEGKEIRALLRP
ncbi:hypothetical protein AYK59_19095 [Pseudomonas synxantha]|uniref:hypothetical protein n=1 Tax=Pseudomonas synxantha TaxID=47883 RepID=UPI00078E3D07|nr:hypothetical protein [Pseudomonas synxantha]AMS22136.1 hypothetical protein AYK59_19095 [Pseudomonas synxantha]